MAVTSGFFNALNNDRTYNADEMGQLFEGIIRDGIFQNVGQALKPTVDTNSLKVTIGTGRCWFNNTWMNNSSVLTLTLATADLLLPRKDAICVVVDKRDSGRTVNIQIVKGKNDSGTPVTLPSTDGMYYYPLCYIKIDKGQTKLTASSLEDLRGRGTVPWITGPLSVINTENTLAKIESDWEAFFTSKRGEINSTADAMISSNQAAFNSWFSQMKSSMDTNQAAVLAAMIIEIQNRLGTTESGSVVYDGLRDANGNTIQDSLNSAILGKLVYTLL